MDVEELVQDLRQSVAEQEQKLAKDKAFLAELEARLPSGQPAAPTRKTPASNAGKTPASNAGRTPASTEPAPATGQTPDLGPPYSPGRRGVLTKVVRWP